MAVIRECHRAYHMRLRGLDVPRNHELVLRLLSRHHIQGRKLSSLYGTCTEFLQKDVEGICRNLLRTRFDAKCGDRQHSWHLQRCQFMTQALQQLIRGRDLIFLTETKDQVAYINVVFLRVALNLSRERRM